MTITTTAMRLPLLAAAVALIVASCGGTSSSSSGVASLEESTDTTAVVAGATSDVDSEQALLDFAACMRENGVDIEDPTVDADGNLEFGRIRDQVAEGDIEIDRESIRAAFDSCGEFLEGATLGFRPGDDEAFQDTLFEYAQCMRDNGVDMDDPDFSGFGPGGDAEDEGDRGGGPFGDIDPDDPDFIAAQEACGDILGGFERIPGARGGPGGGGDES